MQHTPQAREALLRLLRLLDDSGYAFVTPTPATHARVVARPRYRQAASLRDVFGWSVPFDAGLLPPAMLSMLDCAGLLSRRGDLLAADIRVSTVSGTPFLHSAYPTEQKEAVFLGPDTYRFADFIAARLDHVPARARIVDLGAGAGVGAVTAGLRHREAELILVDINRDALFLAGINARHAGLEVTTLVADGLADVTGAPDVVLANPPFIMDPSGRAYRDGGDMHGARISFDWAMQAAARLAPGGCLLLYTGSAIVDGEDALRTALEEKCASLGCTLDYREIDPDIFGEELDEPAYADVERIAAVGIVMRRGG